MDGADPIFRPSIITLKGDRRKGFFLAETGCDAPGASSTSKHNSASVFSCRRQLPQQENPSHPLCGWLLTHRRHRGSFRWGRPVRRAGHFPAAFYWLPRPFHPPQSGHCQMIPLQDMPQKFSCRQLWQIVNPHVRQRQANGNVSRQQ
jgi:hypothetical protein